MFFKNFAVDIDTHRGVGLKIFKNASTNFSIFTLSRSVFAVESIRTLHKAGRPV